MPLDTETQLNKNVALFDTGAAFIHIPKYMHEILVNFWKHDLNLQEDKFFIGKSGLWEIQVDTCTSIYDKLGNFTIILSDQTFELTPKAYLLECTDIPQNSYCSRPTNCLVGIDDFSAADTEYRSFNENVFLLGDLFLKNFYTVYVAEAEMESYV